MRLFLCGLLLAASAVMFTSDGPGWSRNEPCAPGADCPTVMEVLRREKPVPIAVAGRGG